MIRLHNNGIPWARDHYGVVVLIDTLEGMICESGLDCSTNGAVVTHPDNGPAVDAEASRDWALKEYAKTLEKLANSQRG